MKYYENYEDMVILITGPSHVGKTALAKKMESVLEDNREVPELAQKHDVSYILIDDQYEFSIEMNTVIFQLTITCWTLPITK